ncbi:MAG: hypothetical protein NG712_05950 [Omnitrophica bacterium]|nr:hypothetical protein [Candidatus Omnitrophota bacterium]
MNKRIQITLLILLVLACGFIGGILGVRTEKPQQRSFTIEARQYAYDPPRIHVNKGDQVIIKLSSK